MPLNKKGKKIMKAMKKQYGAEEGEAVFYASKNKGVIDDVERKALGGKVVKAAVLVIDSGVEPEKAQVKGTKFSGNY